MSHLTKKGPLYTNDLSGLLVGSSAEVRLEQLAAFLERVGDLARVYRPLLLRATSQQDAEVLVGQFRSALCRASEALLHGHSQAERQDFRSAHPRLAGVVHPDGTRIKPRI